MADTYARRDARREAGKVRRERRLARTLKAAPPVIRREYRA